MTGQSSIDIRPQVSVLSVLKHLNYDPWFALAEFVDNSIQSFRDNREALRKVQGDDYTLRVEIELDRTDGGVIEIRDNAAGIYEEEYDRAFRPAEIPPDTSGLSEFGMGMKSAACWFAEQWSVRSTALGEPVERTVSFDVTEIVENQVEQLEVESKEVAADQHYTVVRLKNLNQKPHSRTIGKIKDHLSSIYRGFTRDGTLELYYNGEKLKYEQPDILEAPYYKGDGGEFRKWKKEIEFDFGRGLSVHGFAAIRETGSTTEAGFSLFRRGRVVEGSADEKYRPQQIVGSGNSFRYQRIFGELHLEGFEVSHTKDGFVWEENEEPFLELLYEELESDPLPLLSQAENYRKLADDKEESQKNIEQATEGTAKAIKERGGDVISEIEEESDTDEPPSRLPEGDVRIQRIVEVELEDLPWRIALELSGDQSLTEWLTISDAVIKRADEIESPSKRDVGVRLALRHPFTLKYAGPNLSEIEPLVRLAAALGLAETAARQSGVRGAGAVRRNVNRLLEDAFAEMDS